MPAVDKISVRSVNDTPTLNPRHLRRRFDAAAACFDTADFVHTVTRDGLCTRLEPLLLRADAVLDLGCATGSAHRMLRKRFARAHLISFDISHNMLVRDRRKRGWLSRRPFSRASSVQGDASQLPFEADSIDLVFSNMLLPFVDSPERVFSEIARVLRGDGVFVFATLGPDSLAEIRRAWSAVDQHAHVYHFPDMHDIGDQLVRAGLRDPVLDVDRLTVRYERAEKLFADLAHVGGRNALSRRDTGLAGRRRFEQMLEALRGQQGDGRIELGLELVYGHCWGSNATAASDGYRIDAGRIPIRRG